VTDVNASGTVLASHTQGSGIDEPLASVSGAGTAFYEADGLGSVSSLSSASGITDTYTYKPFGITTATGSNPNRFRFTGREWDQETGFYYYRARYYDPNAGRFLSEDPIAFKGGINFYRYVRNSASNLSDPSGLYTLKNFPPERAAQMTIAIGKLVAKLNDSCCVDPDVRRRILNHLQPFSYGSGATFTFYSSYFVNGRRVAGAAQAFFDEVVITEDAFNDACPLEGTILHELVHLTWHNAGLAFRDQFKGTDSAETDAYGKAAACYGPNCRKPPEP